MTDLEVAVDAARRGAAIVRDAFGRTAAVSLKARFNPVTEVDQRSEEAIVEVLRRGPPGYGILAEEGSGDAATGMRWIVDPLDGTVNFVHDIPQIGVSVSLYDGDDPLLAVTIDPLRHEEYVAVRGEGASMNGSPISVSATGDLDQSVIATGFPYDRDVHARGLAHTLGLLLAEVNGIRRLGSAVLDFAWVAKGRYDGYWELGLAPWDIAAGILLVREAGGIVTDPAGTPLVPGNPLVVAANPRLHAALVDVVGSGYLLS